MLLRVGISMVEWFSTVPPAVVNVDSSTEHLARNLRLLARTETVKVCVKLNLLTSDATSGNNAIGQIEALRLLHRDGLLPTSWFNNLRRYLLEQAQEGQGAYAINRPGIFELLRWVCTQCEELRFIQLSNSWAGAEAFFGSLLICAELYSEREIAPTLTGEGTPDEQRHKFLLGLRRASIWAPAFKEPHFALGRTKLLLVEHFFDKFPEYRDLFAKATGLTIEDFLTCSAGVVLGGFLSDSEKTKLSSLNQAYEIGIKTLFRNVPHMQSAFQTFLETTSQTVDQLAAAFGVGRPLDPMAAFDFRPLRTRPLLRINENILVIDQRLFVENFSVGPLFVLTAATKSQQPLNDYGVACQNYAFQLLSKTNERYAPELKAPHLVNEPPGNPRPINDIALGDSHCVALFEAKGAWLNDNLLYETDPDAFWNAVVAKYGVSNTGKQEKRKGTAQLFDVISGLENRSVQGIGEAEFVNDAENIVPVLVVQDSLVAASFFPNRLALYFADFFGLKELPDAGSFKHGRLTVHSLITMSLDDLETLETVSPEVPISQLLREYSAEVPLRGDSFTAFLQHRKPPLKTLPRSEMLLVEVSCNFLNEMNEKCFPKDGETKT